MPNSEYIHKSHNVSVLIYHLVLPAKYRRIVFSEEVDNTLKEICLEISKRYEINIMEIGTDKNHVHILLQSVPTYSPCIGSAENGKSSCLSKVKNQLTCFTS